MIVGASSKKPWDEMDIALAKAYQILEMERCPSCGMYTWMCHNEDPVIQFDVEEDICEAKRAIAYKESITEEKPQSWVTLRPVPEMTDKSRDFASLRTPFYEQEALRRNPELAGS